MRFGEPVIKNRVIHPASAARPRDTLETQCPTGLQSVSNRFYGEQERSEAAELRASPLRISSSREELKDADDDGDDAHGCHQEEAVEPLELIGDLSFDMGPQVGDPGFDLADPVIDPRSLEEGLDETLTVHRLPLQGWLRRMLATTNPIESTFSVVETVVSSSEVLAAG